LESVVTKKAPSIPLPTDRPKHVKTGVFHVIALAQVALTTARARSAARRDAVTRLREELEETHREIGLFEEELRLKDVRMQRMTPLRRPHYRGTERMAILEHRAAGGWSNTRTAERFLLSLKNEWLRRILIPLSQEAMRRELAVYASWFAEHRTHQGLGGRTPNEIYDGRHAPEVAFQERQTPMTIPRRELVVHYHKGRRQLPIVELRRAA